MFLHISAYIVLTGVLPKISHASPQLASLDASSPTVKNAIHIFNAIHSSMRQLGSSLNHNGMSFFPARIPAGTEFYHGTDTPEPVDVMEWLAFEPEHALQFAWIIFGANDTEQQTSASPKWMHGSKLTKILLTQQIPKNGEHSLDPPPHNSLQRPLYASEQPSSSKPRPIFRAEPGWLHTYVTKHDLRLVYIDGQSAAKSLKGTLDSQDYIIGSPQPMFFDRERALRMCKLAAEEWHGRIDGFIRMEHGFELILCDFPTHVDLLRVERSSRNMTDMRENIVVEMFSFWKAITIRYHGIGMGRVRLDYARMVTAFAYDIDLFYDRGDLPRLKNIPKEHLARIFADLSKNILLDDDAQLHSQQVDWQAVADMIVARYSDALHELAYSPFYNSEKSIKQASAMLMRPFIDSDQRNASLEQERCASHFMPSSYISSIASTAVSSISERICSTLAMAANMQSLDGLRPIFQDLVEYLRWTSWKECRGCRCDEICFTAIWPAGNVEDHAHPACRNGTEIMTRHDYWSSEEFEVFGTITP